MRRNLALLFMLCFLSTATGFAQSPLHGKWATDRPDPMTPEGQRPQSVQLELHIEDAAASGTLRIGGLGGTFYSLQNGKLSGSKVEFRVRIGTQNPEERTYTIELVDEKTVAIRLSPLALVVGGILDLPAMAALQGARAPVTSSTPPNPQNAQFTGIVADPTGALIPGVTITVTNTETGAVVTAMTDAVGAYAFAGFQPGKAYRVTAALPGFQTVAVTGLELGASPVSRNFELRVSGVPQPQTGACSPKSTEWCRVLHRTK